MELIRQIWHRRKCDVPLHRYCAACLKWECETPNHLGYVLPDRIALLSFGETFYSGARVEVRLNPTSGVVALLSESRDDYAALVFGDKILVRWNLEVDGRPIPPDGRHFQQQPADFCKLITQNWMTQYISEQISQVEPEETPGQTTTPVDEIDMSFAIPETVGDLELERFQAVNHDVE